MEGPKFEFYTIITDFNTGEVRQFNIFNNINIYEYTLKAVKKYVRSPSNYKYKGYTDTEEYTKFEGFCRELKSIIMWQLWSRVEYEVIVSDMFKGKEHKIDCYYQCEKNIEVIAREVIYQYKQWRKQNKNENSI